MANATATRPDKAPTPRKAPRQPPADTVWLRYHPWMEGLVGHMASWAVHLIIFGIGLLFVLAYASGWIKTNKPIPVESVQFTEAGGGGGDPNGTGNDRGNTAPPKEGVQGDKTSPGNKNDATHPADRPTLNVQSHPDDVSFAPPRPIQDDPDAMKSFAGLNNALSDKLTAGNPSKGVAGPGTGGGEGTGTGVGKGPGTGVGNNTGVTKTERMKRMDRWEMSLQTSGDSDFMIRLQMIGTTLAIPDDPDHLDATKFTIIDLSKQPPEIKQGGDVTALDQIWWYIAEPKDTHALTVSLHLPSQPKLIVAFMNRSLEDDLSKNEAAYTRIPPDQISARVAKTYFNVAVRGQQNWTIRVTDVKMK